MRLVDPAAGACGKPRAERRFRRPLAAVGSALALTLALGPQSVSAAEISFSGDRATYNAAPGEQNDLVIRLGTDTSGPYIEFDDRVPMTGSGPNCASVDPGSFGGVPSDRTIVRCDAVPNTTVNLGDGDDQFNIRASGEGTGATTDTVDGGPGNDSLAGWDGNDVLNGGPGNDFVDGDLQSGSFGSQPHWRPGSDTLSGGDGIDRVSYSGTVGVNVALDGAPNDGQSGENDNVGSDVEVVDGSGAADTFVGNDGPNEFYGSSGNDQAFGRGGNDVLWGDVGDDMIYGEGGDDELRGGDNGDLIDGGPGSDFFDGDPPCSSFYCAGGNDEMRARDGFRDSLECGVGADSAIVDQHDDVALDCDSVDRATVDPGPGPSPGVDGPGVASLADGSTRLKKGKIPLDIACGSGPDCDGAVVVKTAKPVSLAVAIAAKRKTVTLGKASFSIPAGQTKTLNAKLTKQGKQVFQRLAKVKAKATIATIGTAGDTRTDTATLTIKRG